MKESSQAQFNLGWLYESGSGVEKNLSEAYKWYTLSGVTAAITSISAKMTPEQILEFEIATAQPRLYELDHELNVISVRNL